MTINMSAAELGLIVSALQNYNSDSISQCDIYSVILQIKDVVKEYFEPFGKQYFDMWLSEFDIL